MKKECFHCKYSGCKKIDSNLALCKIDGTEKWIDNDTAEECEDFILHTPLESDAIEVESVFNIWHTCPYCGHEDVEYDAIEGGEGEMDVECSECGKKYHISWCLYQGGTIMILQYRDYTITGSPEEIKQFIDLIEQINFSCSSKEIYHRPICPHCGTHIVGWIGCDEETGISKYKCDQCGTVFDFGN